MNKALVLAGKVLTPEGIMDHGVVCVSGGVIRTVEQRSSYRGPIHIDAGDRLIAPGFIDIHVHGAAGHGFMNSGSDGIVEALRYHRRYGTTGLLATTSTSSGEVIVRGLSDIAQVMSLQAKESTVNRGARILGVHIEGPYLNEKRAGAQNPEWLRLPDIEEYKQWERLAPVRMITIAPELEGAEPLIRYIRSRGEVLISAGHTDATFEEMQRGMEWGISHCTHFGNGMRGLHHREPGVLGTGLLEPGLTVELIADGIHVHPKVLELVYRVKGAGHTVLITDAVAYCGLPDGVYGQGQREITVQNRSVRLRDGGLAGSSLTMNRAARQMAELGVTLTDIWHMASALPARLIGLGARKGQIKPGMDADLIIIDDDFEVKLTMLEGVPDEGEYVI